jgi:hypothetical protein
MIEEVVNSFNLLLEQVHALVADIEDARMTAQPAGVSNHAAWTLGHLIHSCHGMAVELGMPGWLGGEWERSYGGGSTPLGDRAAYPSKETLLAALDDAAARVVDRLRALGPAGMAAPLPDVRHRDLLPTVGHAAVHIFSAHTGHHVGQLAAWRRAMLSS